MRKLENYTKFFYTEAVRKTKDDKVKEFLAALVKSEEAHYDALRKVNNFMDDPANWFATQWKF